MKTKTTGTDCTTPISSKEQPIQFKGSFKKIFEVNFSGGDITSNGGILLLRQADNKLSLTKHLAAILPDPRNQSMIKHSWLSMIKQRIFGIALGYEDLNDHQDLRKDAGFKAVLDKDADLASTPTMWRMEQVANRDSIVNAHGLLFENFISSYKTPPEEIILDFDATDDIIHGNQEGGFYNGYYQNYCFLPLYVYCQEHLLVSYLRPSNIDGARHSWAILSLLVKNIRKIWPKTKIIFRGDSGFFRWRMLRWCDNNDVKYVVGAPKNSVLMGLAEPLILKAQEYFDHTQEKQRIFGEVQYAAQTWDKERRVIIKAEHLEKGSNPRFLVTNLLDAPQHIYDNIYCLRGDMENRIKEQQLDLFSDRTSCNKWWPNQLRVLFSAFAYLLILQIKTIGLKETKLANAQVGTIRLKLLKIGAAIVKNTRRIRFLLSSACNYKQSFIDALARLSPS